MAQWRAPTDVMGVDLMTRVGGVRVAAVELIETT
jgi:hypothetical protein